MRSQRTRTLVGALVVLLLVLGGVRPAAADAGSDLALAVPEGPPGTRTELFSPDFFDMGVDRCPAARTTTAPGPTDAFEVRWTLELLAPGVRGDEIAEGSGYRYTTLSVETVAEVTAGVWPTTVGEPWRATLTIPTSVSPGQHLVVRGACWRTGPDVPGGAEISFTYYYLPIFTVTGPGRTAPPTTAPLTTAPPADPVHTSPSAAPVRGAATFTG